MIPGAQDAADGFEDGDVLIHEQDLTRAYRRCQSSRRKNPLLRRLLEWNLDCKGRAVRLHVSDSDRATVFGDNAVANTEAETSALADGLRRIKRIENLGGFSNARTAVGELYDQAVAAKPRVNPQIAFACRLKNGIDGVIHQIQKNLLKLMGIGGGDRQVWCEFEMHADVLHAEIVITQSQCLFQNLIDLD